VRFHHVIAVTRLALVCAVPAHADKRLVICKRPLRQSFRQRAAAESRERRAGGERRAGADPRRPQLDGHISSQAREGTSGDKTEAINTSVQIVVSMVSTGALPG
jgi:hypothetical protein